MTLEAIAQDRRSVALRRALAIAPVMAKAQDANAREEKARRRGLAMDAAIRTVRGTAAPEARFDVWPEPNKPGLYRLVNEHGEFLFRNPMLGAAFPTLVDVPVWKGDLE